ncbi:unnamed protein product [Agarophyton chilense]|eukprot:gb/GEZJ01004167.1/.p1 GENE.gb/GEZJ01004167.1/~~gb/GEZJ01004167.1/.p1  ORF type:complete len:817 (-),score=105.85 gb/GEZJ01004167.1/:127-2577(-)
MEFGFAIVIDALQQPHIPSRITAARTIKNAIVGNPTNKRLFLAKGVLHPLINAASNEHPELAEQAIAAIGSLACCLPPVPIESIANPLLRCLFSNDVRPVSAATRALKLVVCSDAIDIKSLVPVFTTQEVAERLVQLLLSEDDGLAEVCAVIVSRIAISRTEVVVFERANAVSALVHILCRTNHERCTEACISALASLSQHDSSVSRQLTNDHGLVTIVMPLTNSTTPSLRLAACRILTIFQSDGLIAHGLDCNVVVSLVNLLDVPARQIQITSARTLSDLVANNPELQSVATENNAVSKLVSIFSQTMSDKVTAENDDDMTDSDPISVQKNEYRTDSCASALAAIASLTRNIDASRVAVVKEDALPKIIAALEEENTDVVFAAVQCIRSLSRSVKIVRRDIADEKIGTTLLRLASISNPEIQRCASAALCNFVLEFSPIRTSILASGGTSVLIGLLGSMDDELRENALWAVKNLLFKADSGTKTAVMNQLGYKNLQALCTDKRLRVRELAMNIIRNLACSGSTQSQREQLDALFAATGNRLISILSGALKTDSDGSELAVQALYVVCNIASGTEEHKASLIDSEIPQLILQWTSNDDERARIAAVWCAINLSWNDKPLQPRSSSHQRSQRPRMRMPRFEMLQRQHLPVPSSPFSQRVLEMSDRNYDTVTVIDRQVNSSDADMDVETREDLMALSSRRQSVQPRASPRQAPSSSQRNQAPKTSGYQWRIERLRELGFEGRLRSLTNDPHIEVQGRARAALEFFDCGDVNPLDYSPSALLEYEPSSTSVTPRQSSRTQPHSIIHRVLASDSSDSGSS